MHIRVRVGQEYRLQLMCGAVHRGVGWVGGARCAAEWCGVM